MFIGLVLRTFTVGVAACLAMSGLVGMADAATINYVAFGDSYVSYPGCGANPGSDPALHSYPVLYSTETGASLQFPACEGATTDTVRSSQLGNTLNGDTTLVSITIGGNDVGGFTALAGCARNNDAKGCKISTDEATRKINTELPSKLNGLNGLYPIIRSKAPKAKVVVLGYPNLLSTNCPVPPLSIGYVNDMVNAAAVVTQREAATAGFTFVDGRRFFVGHEACTTKPYIDFGTLHPNADGHQFGWLPALKDGIR